MTDVTRPLGSGRPRPAVLINRCMGCAGTHDKCVAQTEAERLVYQLAEALESRDPLRREEAREAYRRWA